MNSVAKGILILAGMLLVLGLGIGYLIINDPANTQRDIFSLAYEEFEPMAGELQKVFHKNEALPTSQKTVTKQYRDNTGKKIDIVLNIKVLPDKVTIEFPDTSGKKTSVEFEPIIKVHKKTRSTSVKWVCSGGTMLLKYRSEPCRTLKGLSFNTP